MARADTNTLLTLLKDPKSIDLHKMAESRAGVDIDPSMKQEFIKDRARHKKVRNMDELYKNLNDMEKSGALDMWIQKFNKRQYLKEDIIQSIEIFQNILLENNNLTFMLNKERIVSLMQEMDGAAAAGMTSVGMGPAATMGGQPSKNRSNQQLINCGPEGTLSDCSKTHQDINISTKGN